MFVDVKANAMHNVDEPFEIVELTRRGIGKIAILQPVSRRISEV